MLKRERLRIGLLLDSESIPAWAWEMLKLILDKDLAEIDFVLLNQNPKPSGSKSPIFYRIFSKLDRTLFKVSLNAFERKSIFLIPGLKAEIIPIRPIQKKFSDSFEKRDLEKAASKNPDILIRLGFRILKGEILKIPKLGVWSYHHGDNLVNKGGPPCFWEVMLGWEETGSVLQILSEKLDDGQVIYRSWSRTDPLSVHRNANKVYWKSLYFIPRNLERINQVGIEAWKEEISIRESKFQIKDETLRKPPGNSEMMLLFIKWAFRNVKRKLHEFLNREIWSIWLFKKGQKEGVQIPNPPNSYLADPILIEQENKTWIFVEQFKYKSQKGFIAFSEIKNGKPGNFFPAFEEPFHLSYPFVFKDGGDFWMILESAKNKELRIYQAEEFPHKWTWVQSQFKGLELFDPTLCKKDGLFWLFVNQKNHPGTSSFDELFLYYSKDFRQGNWVSHPQNPIVSDVKSSRPAGQLFCEDGVWYRPAQDSAKHYGHRIRIQKILDWDTQTYREETDQLIEADWEPDWQGTHTINFSSEWMVLDTFKR